MGGSGEVGGSECTGDCCGSAAVAQDGRATSLQIFRHCGVETLNTCPQRLVKKKDAAAEALRKYAAFD